MPSDRSVLGGAAIVAAFVLAAAAAGAAEPGPRQAAGQQQQLQSPQPPSPASQTNAPPPAGVSVARIRRLLREAAPAPRSGASSLLNLTYHVEVVGHSPRINLLKGFNISPSSAVQYGGMTHAEFLREVGPPFRRTR